MTPRRLFVRCTSIPAALGLAFAALAPSDAADLLTTHRLSAALATQAAVAAAGACRKLGFSTTVAVTDADGVLQALLRDDGAGIHTVQAAQDKAFTAATYGRATSVTAERQKGRGPFAVLVKQPHLLADEGGLPIKVGDELVGAIGVSGSAGKDEECGTAGIDSIRSRLR